MKRLTLLLPAIALVVSACGVPNVNAPSTPSTITYRVTGGSAQSVTYSLDGAQEQKQSVKLPFSKSVTLPTGFAVYSIVAQNAGSGAITCTVLDESGAVLKEATSEGAYSVVTCSGSVS